MLSDQAVHCKNVESMHVNWHSRYKQLQPAAAVPSNAATMQQFGQKNGKGKGTGRSRLKHLHCGLLHHPQR